MELSPQNFKKDYVLSRIDARVKLIFTLTILIMVLSDKGFILPLLVTLLCSFFCIKMRIPLRVFLLRFSEPVFIATIVLILKFFFSGNDVMFSVDIIGLKLCGHKDGLTDGLMIVSRILGAVSIVAVMGFCTPFTEFIAGLSWLKVPKSFIEILTFAYRYIFVLLEDATVIYSAQKNRLGYSSMRRGLSSFGTLAGSLILKAFEHSDNITRAMVQRGYDGTLPILKHKSFKPSEIMGAVLAVIVMGLVWRIQ